MIRSYSIFLLILLLDSCIDRLTFDTENLDEGKLVVDGLITNAPGPYFVRLNRASAADDILNFSIPVAARRVTIYDGSTSEDLIPIGNGIYSTSDIQGEVGKEYHVQVELSDGTLYESEPQLLQAVPEIDSLYFKWDVQTMPSGSQEYGFRVFIDSDKRENSSEFLRWKFTGTYTTFTYPELHKFHGTNCQIPPGAPDPLPCSGFVWSGQIGGPGFLKKVSECTCCRCWVSDYENKPVLNDKLITDGTYKGVQVGYVPFNQWTFGRGKYMVKVEQFSLSQEALEFWKIIRDQKEGASSLFQPSFGAIKSNIYSTNTENAATGLFTASAVKSKVIFISPNDAQTKVPPPDINPPEDNCALWYSCTDLWLNSATVPPPEWVD